MGGKGLTQGTNPLVSALSNTWSPQKQHNAARGTLTTCLLVSINSPVAHVHDGQIRPDTNNAQICSKRHQPPPPRHTNRMPIDAALRPWMSIGRLKWKFATRTRDPAPGPAPPST